MERIPVYKPDLSGNEKKYVDDCIDSTWISSKGKYVGMFEDAFAKYIGTNYAVSVNNGTIALHLALLMLGIGEGDEVIVPTFTYIASVNAITYTGAKPVFADSSEETWQVDPEQVQKKITKRTKAIIAVHLYGHPCDMDALMGLCNKYGLYMIEDCAEAIGSVYKGKKVGNIGHVSCFSFFGNKTITTGEGGMVLTNEKYLFEKAVHLKNQGLADGYEYWHNIVGYNYRMTNICAAIGLAQLERIDSFLEKKRKIAIKYKENLKTIPVVTHKEEKGVVHSYWMNSIITRSNEERKRLNDYLEEKKIETRPTFYPVHMMPMYLEKGDYHVAEKIGLRGINLPSWPGLSDEQITYICEQIDAFYVGITNG